MNRPVVRMALFASLAAMSTAAPARAGFITAVPGSNDPGVTTDLFDVSQGTTVLGSSPLNSSGFDARSAFGYIDTGGFEPANTIFADSPPTGVDFLSFKTASAVNLTSFRLLLTSTAGTREAAGFRLYASTDGVAYSLASTTAIVANYAASYGSQEIAITDTVNQLGVQYFRAEFDRRQSSFTGARVIELDGFGSLASVPEPASVAMLGLGGMAAALGGLARARRGW